MKKVVVRGSALAAFALWTLAAGCGGGGSSGLPADAGVDANNQDVPVDQAGGSGGSGGGGAAGSGGSGGSAGSGGGGGAAGSDGAGESRPLPPATPGQVGCGMAKTCDTTNEVCCVDYPVMCDGSADGTSGGDDASGDAGGKPTCGKGSGGAACVAKGTCSGDLSYGCDGAEDCGKGRVCCGLLKRDKTIGGTVGRVGCAAMCAMGEVELCHSDAECPMERPMCCDVPGANGRLAACAKMCN